MVPSAWFQLLGTWYQYLVHGSTYLVPGAKYVLHGTMYWVLGTWYLILLWPLFVIWLLLVAVALVAIIYKWCGIAPLGADYTSNLMTIPPYFPLGCVYCNPQVCLQAREVQRWDLQCNACGHAAKVYYRQLLSITVNYRLLPFHFFVLQEPLSGRART